MEQFAQRDVFIVVKLKTLMDYAWMMRALWINFFEEIRRS